MKDTKIFYGCELGQLTSITGLFSRVFKYPRSNLDNFDKIEWLNTQLPEGVYLDISYSYRDDEEDNMKVHLSMIDDYDVDTDDCNIDGYTEVLKMLEKPFTEPKQYTLSYYY
jgi:hypothetical protein